MKARSIILIALMLVTTALVTNCAPVEETPEVTATEAAYPPAPDYIEVGASIPEAGKYGGLGKQVLAGYQYAVDDINAAGGVFVAEYNASIPLRLNYYDDESDPSKTNTNLEQLYAENDVVAYLGGAGSDVHAAGAAIAEKNKVPYLGISFAWYNIHLRGYDYLFSPFIKSPAQARDLFLFLDEMVPQDPKPNIAIFQEETDYGIEINSMFQATAKGKGYPVVYYGTYAPRTTDYSSMIQAAENAQADILLGSVSGPDGMAIMRGLAELDWTPKFTLLIRGPDEITWGENLGTLGDFVAFFPGWHYSEDFPGVEELNAKHQAEFGRPADVLVGPAYACVQILADAIERAGTLDREALRDSIADTDMTTVIGPVTFNSDGTGNVLNPLLMWLNGQQEVIWPLDMATADFVYPAPAFDQR
jgi:branched-chain amino acid transport system substrate-binding protein